MRKVISSLCLFFFLNILFSQELRPRVYITISEECPISIAMVDDLKEIHSRYHKEAVFTLVFPMLTSDTVTSKVFIEEYELLGFEIMVKNANKFCKAHELKITPESMIISPDNKMIYRGRINSLYTSPGMKVHKSIKHDLFDNLQIFFANQPIKPNWPKAVGCAITYEQ